MERQRKKSEDRRKFAQRTFPPQVFGSMFSKGRGAPACLDKPDHSAHLTPTRTGEEGPRTGLARSPEI